MTLLNYADGRAVKRGGKKIMRAFKMTEVSAVDKPCQEGALALIIKRDSGGATAPIATFQKDYASGRYDHCTSAEFDAILQGEAEKRHAVIHEQEIAAGAQKYTSLAKVYTELLAEPVGRAIYKAARNAALGGALEASPVEKVAAPSPIADERLNISLETARALQNPYRKVWPQAMPLAKASRGEPGASATRADRPAKPAIHVCR